MIMLQAGSPCPRCGGRVAVEDRGYYHDFYCVQCGARNYFRGSYGGNGRKSTVMLDRRDYKLYRRYLRERMSYPG